MRSRLTVILGLVAAVVVIGYTFTRQPGITENFAETSHPHPVPVQESSPEEALYRVHDTVPSARLPEIDALNEELSIMDFSVATVQGFDAASKFPGVLIQRSETFLEILAELGESAKFVDLDAFDADESFTPLDIAFAKALIPAIVELTGLGQPENCLAVVDEWASPLTEETWAENMALARMDNVAFNWLKLDDKAIEARFYSMDSIPAMGAAQELVTGNVSRESLWRGLAETFPNGQREVSEISYSVIDTRGEKHKVDFVFTRSPEDTTFSYYGTVFRQSKHYVRGTVRRLND